MLAFVACTQKSNPVVDDPSPPGGGGTDPRYSFSPQDAPRTCAKAEDCVVLTALRNCMSCCGHGAVARGEAERAYAAAVEACEAPGGPGRGECAMACGAPQASCFEGTCVVLGGPGAGTTCPSTGTTGTTDGGAPAELGPGPACGATAVQTGFEDGLDPSWTSSDPSAIQIDRTEPLAGGASLKISYRQTNAFLTIAQSNACAVRIAFTVRTRLLASGLTLARIIAGDGNWFHVRLDGCALSISEEVVSSAAASLGAGSGSWSIPDDTPVRIVLTFDLRTKTFSSAAAPLGAPLPTPKTAAMRGVPSGIRAIELGSAPGIARGAVGSVWFDDLVID